MKVIFVLRGGAGTITWEVPETVQPTFNFVGCARGMRCDGFFQADDLHIRYDEMAVVILNREGAAPPEIMVPGTETRQ